MGTFFSPLFKNMPCSNTQFAACATSPLQLSPVQDLALHCAKKQWSWEKGVGTISMLITKTEITGSAICSTLQSQTWIEICLHMSDSTSA